MDGKDIGAARSTALRQRPVRLSWATPSEVPVPAENRRGIHRCIHQCGPEATALEISGRRRACARCDSHDWCPMNPYAQTLDGKVAFVTGVGSGIGKAAALLLARAGARVGGLTTQEKEAQATCQLIRDQSGEALPLAGNVASAADIQSAIERIKREWGRLDIVVANAGINGLWAPLDEIGEEEWDETLDINLKGTFLTVKHSLPLLKRTGGAIVIVASINGTRIFSNSGATAYSSSKAAQVAFSRMTALEFAKHRIRVNTICPGAIDTKIGENTTHQNLEGIREPVIFPEGEIPLTNGKSGSAEQVARLIWFLSSDLSDHITGTEVYIDGGQSLLQG